MQENPRKNSWVKVTLQVYSAAISLAVALVSPVATAQDVVPDADATALRKFTEDTSKDLERVRGRTAKPLPPVKVIGRKEYLEEYVLKSVDFMWGGDFERSLDIFRALGMIPADLKTKPFLEKYGSRMTAAAYDFLGKRVVFPETDVNREVLVHELCHAMQDQRHDIAKLMRTTHGELDGILAMGALIEGEATNVQIRYRLGRSRLLGIIIPYGTLRKHARAEAEKLRRRIMRWMPDVPANLIRAQAFVYDEGVLFVERLRRRKLHWVDVDAAFARPPRSTTQILHPKKYLDGEWPVTIDVTGKQTLLAGYRLVTENTLGEFGTWLFLSTHLKEVGPSTEAAAGWRGDRVLLYRAASGAKPVLVWISIWETPERAEAMSKDLRTALVHCAARVPWYGLDTHKRGETAVRVRRTGDRVVAVIDPARRFERLLGTTWTTTQAKGKPLGDRKKQGK